MAEQSSALRAGDPGESAGIPATPAATPPTPPEATTPRTETATSPRESPDADGDLGSNDGDSGAVEQAKEKAQSLTSTLSERATSEVDKRSSDLGQRAGSVASDLRQVGEQLEGQDNSQAAKLAGSAADRAERVASYLDDADGQRLLSDVEDLGRRQPWLVLAGGVAFGIAAARLLKASSGERYAQSQGASQQASA
jgi:hypothetical protein